MRWLAPVLLGLLVLAWAILRLGSPSADVHPAPDDSGLGGLSLFAGALRTAGYQVAFEPSSRPKFSPKDIVVAPLLGGRRLPEAVVKHVSAGGRAMALGIPEELQTIGATAAIDDRQNHSVTVDETTIVSRPPPEAQIAATAIWSGEIDDIATLAQVGKGRVATLEAGALATNRFLGRRDSARVAFSTLEALRPKKGERLVFVALGYGESEDLGPVEAIGPWAVGALWQGLAVLVAFGVARGIRFGLPAPEPRSRRGARELLDAVAGHYKRGRRTDAVLGAAARERADDVEIQAVAARTKVSEDEARRALAALESRPRKRR